MSCIISKLALSQSKPVQDEFVHEYNEYTKLKVKAVTNHTASFYEEFIFRQSDRKLCLIYLWFKGRSMYQFYVINDHLRSIRTHNPKQKPKKVSFNDYYFNKDSLLQWTINYEDSLDINQLLEMYKVFKAKADSL